MVTKEGDLITSTDHRLLKNAIMSPQLYANLLQSEVNFQDDGGRGSKSSMIQKLSDVIGINCPNDPDESYVLTYDNAIKILSIQVRFW